MCQSYSVRAFYLDITRYNAIMMRLELQSSIFDLLHVMSETKNHVQKNWKSSECKKIKKNFEKFNFSRARACLYRFLLAPTLKKPRAGSFSATAIQYFYQSQSQSQCQFLKFKEPEQLSFLVQFPSPAALLSPVNGNSAQEYYANIHQQISSYGTILEKSIKLSLLS